MYLAFIPVYQKLQFMKQIIVKGAFLLLALFAGVSSFAQSDDAAARQAQMKQKLITDLKMTDAQADSVVSITSSYMPQRKEIYQDQSMSMDDKKAKMKAITDEADKRIEPVLGEPLFKQYQDWRMKNMQMMKGGKSGGQ
jgi:hypothetical protein